MARIMKPKHKNLLIQVKKTEDANGALLTLIFELEDKKVKDNDEEAIYKTFGQVIKTEINAYKKKVKLHGGHPGTQLTINQLEKCIELLNTEGKRPEIESKKYNIGKDLEGHMLSIKTFTLTFSFYMENQKQALAIKDFYKVSKDTKTLREKNNNFPLYARRAAHALAKFMSNFIENGQYKSNVDKKNMVIKYKLFGVAVEYPLHDHITGQKRTYNAPMFQITQAQLLDLIIGEDNKILTSRGKKEYDGRAVKEALEGFDYLFNNMFKYDLFDYSVKGESYFITHESHLFQNRYTIHKVDIDPNDIKDEADREKYIEQALKGDGKVDFYLFQPSALYVYKSLKNHFMLIPGNYAQTIRSSSEDQLFYYILHLGQIIKSNKQPFEKKLKAYTLIDQLQWQYLTNTRQWKRIKEGLIKVLDRAVEEGFLINYEADFINTDQADKSLLDECITITINKDMII